MTSDRGGGRGRTSTAGGARFVTGENLFSEWAHSVRSGSGPVLYKHEFPFPEIGPGLVTVIGGAPGAGKTTFTMQTGVEMVRFNSDLRLLVCNCEMAPAALMDKTLARLSGIDAHDVRHRRFGEEHGDRLSAALATIQSFIGRITFLTAPFDIRNIAATADETSADVIVIDYVQRFTIPSDDSEARHRVNRMMDYLRQFASAGVAVVVVSAVGRSRDRAGRSSYASEGLSLASFRESSELEFGADDALILAPIDTDDPDHVRLAHLKARHGMQVTQDFLFNRQVQAFSLIGAVADAPSPPAAARGPRASLAEEIRLLWEASASAPEGDALPDDAPEEPDDRSSAGPGDEGGDVT